MLHIATMPAFAIISSFEDEIRCIHKSLIMFHKLHEDQEDHSDPLVTFSSRVANAPPLLIPAASLGSTPLSWAITSSGACQHLWPCLLAVLSDDIPHFLPWHRRLSDSDGGGGKWFVRGKWKIYRSVRAQLVHGIASTEESSAGINGTSQSFSILFR